MTPEEYAEVRAAYFEVAELPPGERRAALDARGLSDEMRAEVESLLAQDPAAQLEETALGQGASTLLAHVEAEPAAIAGCRILSRLGEGGMGIVYLAEQSTPVRRQVAIKVIKRGMDSHAIIARFERERQALARMEHDGIAKVHACGTTETGQPYFLMEFVRGRPLNAFCDERKLSIPERLRLMRKVCAAVQHAHQKGIVHRDLKPGNVLVHESGGEPSPKVIDFGLAKAYGDGLAEGTLFTQAGQILGTPDYMAPEQADPTYRDIDTRTDIYALGVMLYETLTGSLPFEPDELRAGGVLAMQRILRDVDPPKPSTRVSSIGDASGVHAQLRHASKSALLRMLRSDLDWVVLKAIDKDPERRYQSPGELSDDLQRFLDREPLIAGPPSTSYRVRKLLDRHRGRVIAAASVFVTAVIGTVVAVGFAWSKSKLADEMSDLADHNGELAKTAQEARTAADADAERLAVSMREFHELKSVVLFDEMVAAEQTLYPPWPRKIDAMRGWLDQQWGALVATRPDIEATVQSLHARAAERTAAEQFLHDQLSDLLDRIALWEAEVVPTVTQRLTWAEHLAGLSGDHPHAATDWATVRRSIAESEAYAHRSIDLSPRHVVGLVPIGANPVTELWEFYDLRSAWDGATDPAAIPIPEHRPDGSITVDEHSGIVFVLLPGGSFTMGAQYSDPEAPSFDPSSHPTTMPNEVSLAPFLLARHELTAGQWSRMYQRLPQDASNGARVASAKATANATARILPVVDVSWAESQRTLNQLGMSLPTEAQWEYACRAGTTTIWPCAPEELPEYANVADRATERVLPGQVYEDWDDGYGKLAPVGSFRPNAFGLFDMMGNASERCVDWYGPYAFPARPGDGSRPQPAHDGTRVSRGGSFWSIA